MGKKGSSRKASKAEEEDSHHPVSVMFMDGVGFAVLRSGEEGWTAFISMGDMRASETGFETMSEAYAWIECAYEHPYD